MTAADPDLAREIAAHRAWWELAGVDCDFADNATAWLAEPVAPPPAGEPAAARERAGVASSGPAVAEKAPAPGLLGDSPPETPEAFREWWLAAPGLDAIGPRGRVPPRGQAGAALMVLVVHPEEGDAGRLLAGPQGRLLDAILAAMGIAPDEAYIASALPRFTPLADCEAEARRGMAEVLSHHIALASPQRIVAFGTGLADLLGPDAKKDYVNLPGIHHEPGNVPVLLSGDLESLMSMSHLKAQFWRRWIEWSGELV
ncbi:uracil-DNA glycosylase family protein [Erythrobacter sp. HL-111]|uniref:uracil-DNA glycosylase family protein n=1 Tax=Erythrobacter sp. HL-111 TaxID=1798193 RepID=UPI0006D9E755|nr:uracil-DNA glycosylase family protein [Erythrobacter sp. HL-111]KPP96566.1 MAG: DNA polymerase bacteriophage-type [Erythrobacteraceae bacterium HL-111]SDS03986.1 DNA polymerase [Erythrobacter sp. HL-111]